MLLFYLSAINESADREKFTCIYNEYRRRMKYIALRMLENEADAEDALQDSFEKLIKALPRIKDPVSDDTAAFLTVIVKNTCRDYLRRRKSHKAYVLDKVDSKKATFHADLLDDMNVKAVWSAIERLPDKYHDVLFLKHYYDLPPQRVAEIMGISVQTVYKRLERARQRLKTDLKKEEIMI